MWYLAVVIVVGLSLSIWLGRKIASKPDFVSDQWLREHHYEREH